LPESTLKFHSIISCVSAPPNYADVVSEEEFSRHVTAYPPPIDCEEQLCCPVFAYIQEFRFQPPPLYSEVKKKIKINKKKNNPGFKQAPKTQLFGEKSLLNL